MKEVKFNTSPEDNSLIRAIVQRVTASDAVSNLKLHPLEISMDITACHCNGCELDLRKLNEAPLDTFLHDVLGINRHIDRNTGQLTDHFLPRCAK